MENVFIFNKESSYLDIVDAIDRKLEQALCVTKSIWVGAFDETEKIVIGHGIISGSLWVVNDLLEEIKNLSRELHEMTREKKYQKYQIFDETETSSCKSASHLH